jgi:hypothetical protein
LPKAVSIITVPDPQIECNYRLLCWF